MIGGLENFSKLSESMIKKLTIKDNLVNNRESNTIEFKESFNKNFKSYIKTICSFANSKGGAIIFGVKDKPRKPVGINDVKLKEFRDFDCKNLETELQSYLSETIQFKLEEFTQKINEDNLVFGVLSIEEASNKPVICKKNYDRKPTLREGAIYFRYNSKSEEIKAVDLLRLIQREKEKERDLWIKNITKMAQVGITNAGVFNYEKGEIYAGQNKILLDKDILDKIKFIKRGEFVEEKGAPALVLKGEIENMEAVKLIKTNPDEFYPYEGRTSVIEELKSKGIKERILVKGRDKSVSLIHIFDTFKKKNKVEENDKFFWCCGKNQSVKKYSDDFFQKLMDCISNENELSALFCG